MFTAAKLAMLLGTTIVSGSTTELSEIPVVVPQTMGVRPAFVLGSGDALGVQIRVNDVILARRLEEERIRHAAVETDHE